MQEDKKCKENEELKKSIEAQKEKIELLQQKKIQDAQIEAIEGKNEEKQSKNIFKSVKENDALTSLANGEVISKKLAAQDLQAQIRKTRIFYISIIPFSLLSVGFAAFNFILSSIFFMISFIVITVGLIMDVKKENYLVQKYDLPIKKLFGK